MRTIVALAMTLTLAGLGGCRSSSPQGGAMEKDQGFRIVVRRFTLDLDQGDVKTTRVSLKRGDYFKQDVHLQISVPENLTIEPNNLVVEASDKPDVDLTITADTDAALGKYRIAIKATPETGEPAAAELIVKVKAR
ncbi:MAG: hypothetical protein JSW27_05770 [Phycisphaerales bacterium]|nr:MAG: hypothetical protein JSW27_05770 [Phycisphaerales bacterium]